MKLDINKKHLAIFLVLIGLLISVGIVYAAFGSVPNPGHAVSELQKCGAVGEILKINSAGNWGCAVDEAGSGGGVSSVEGLTGAVDLAVTGYGSLSTSGSTVTINVQGDGVGGGGGGITCAQVPGCESGTGDITGVTAGTGLTGGGTIGTVTLSADTNYLQRRVSSSCSSGSSIRVINSDGTVSCETDDTGGGIDGSGFMNYIPRFQDSNTLENSIIYQTGNQIGIGTTSPSEKLTVWGTIYPPNGYYRIGNLQTGGTPSSLCRVQVAAGDERIGYCSSSIRYKNSIQDLLLGLDVVEKLRPAQFKWKQTDEEDLGLVAEEVFKINPLLVTFNNKGEIEGVKYEQLTAVLINAIKDQQKQIEQLESEICKLNPRAEVCKK